MRPRGWGRTSRLWSRFAIVLVATVLACPVGATAVGAQDPALPDPGWPGESEGCEVDTNLLLAEMSAALGITGTMLGLVASIWLDELGWTWVDPAHPMHELTGIVEGKSKVAVTDLPAEHDSHDQNFTVVPDPDSRYLMSDVNVDDEQGRIENEWEVDDFPQWAWPNLGDRVWVNGDWILDCSHGEGEDNHHAAEIHPPRAVASIRDQMHTLPSTGETPVAVKATDLYIHGNAGYVTTILECGVSNVILLGKFSDCADRPGIDEDFDFDIPLGAPPFAGAVPEWTYTDGPGNSIDIAPELSFEENGTIGDKDNTGTGGYHGPVVHVHVPLAGTGVTKSDVYARRIVAGWVAPPPKLHHYQIRLREGWLYDDKDTDPKDCDCTPFRVTMDRGGEEEWYQLAQYDRPTDAGITGCGDNTIGDWDDTQGLCDSGHLRFTGPEWDFYLPEGQDATVSFNGYDSDCIDETFGWPHSIEVNGFLWLSCLVSWNSVGGDGPQNDDMGITSGILNSTNILDNDGVHYIGNSNYKFRLEAFELPLGFTSADLSVTKSAAASVLAGDDLSYTVTGTNNGPTDATDLVLTDTLPASTTFKSATPSAGGTCTTPAVGTNGTVTCTWLGATDTSTSRSVVITVETSEPQTLVNTATVSSATQDLNPSNDQSSATTQVVCTITGTSGDDLLTGTAGNDVICGLGGNDTIKGGAGNDRIFGGAGNDNISGGDGNDQLFGGSGNDTVSGDDGNDILHGGSGVDVVTGGNGDDRLFGEDDADNLKGNKGVDYLDGGGSDLDHCNDSPSPAGSIVNCEFTT